MKKTTQNIALAIMASAMATDGISITAGSNKINQDGTNAITAAGQALVAAQSDTQITSGLESAKSSIKVAYTSLAAAKEANKFLDPDSQLISPENVETGLEAFSGVPSNINVAITAMTNNEKDVNADAVSDALLPDVEFNPANSGIEIKWSLIDVRKGVEDETFDLNDAAKDYTLWGGTSLPIIPYLRQDGVGKNDDVLLTELSKDVAGGKTCPYLFNKKIDVLKTGLTGAELSAGGVTITKEISNQVSFKNIVIKTPSSHFKVSVALLSTNVWGKNPNGQARDIFSKLAVENVIVPLSTKDENNASISTGITGVNDDWSMTISTRIDGDLNTSKGSLHVTNNGLELVNVIDANNVPHTEGAVFEAVQTAFSEVSGFEMNLEYTNADAGNVGYIISGNLISKTIPVGNKMPLNILSSSIADNGPDTDIALLSTQVSPFANSYSSMLSSSKTRAAVQMIKDIEALAKSGAGTGDKLLPSDNIKPYFNRSTVDIKDVNNLKGSEKIADVSGTIIAQIRQELQQMFNVTKYEKVIQMFGYSNFVISIAGDSIPMSYIEGKEDEIYKSKNARIEFASSQSAAYSDQIIISFKLENISVDSPNILGLGVTPIAPELVRDRNGAFCGNNDVKYKSLYPRYRHIGFVKAVAVVVVTGLDKVGSKSYQATKEITE